MSRMNLRETLKQRVTDGLVERVAARLVALEEMPGVGLVAERARERADAWADRLGDDLGAYEETLAPKAFLARLREEVEAHPAVNHMLLCRLAHVPFTREDYKVMGLMHYPLVGRFTSYMERLLVRGPSSDAKSWLAKVLVDEYGEGSDGKDHATLYLEFLRACGVEPGEERSTKLHPAVVAFIREHVRLCTDEPFLVGLGALGPGHEWSIPKMFPFLVDGLRRAGFAEDEISYFWLHMEQDVDHGNWLQEALELYSTTREQQAQIRRGALLSLEARYRFWSGVQDKIVRWRQPENMHLRTQARRGTYRDDDELTLDELLAELSNAPIAVA
jgi:pyrroloquinoline-quinone synthase